jgi:phosphoenolpyruvate-protein kinase (PTS system EI component)
MDTGTELKKDQLKQMLICHTVFVTPSHFIIITENEFLVLIINTGQKVNVKAITGKSLNMTTFITMKTTKEPPYFLPMRKNY